jgi:hypothetical protein
MQSASKYYVNKSVLLLGTHEIHKENCKWMPSDKDLLYLGHFESHYGAILEAKRTFARVDACNTCTEG